MVSRDLTCDEIMPPLDDGESLVRIVRTVPSIIRIPRYQHSTSQEGGRDNISYTESGIGSSSKSSHFITCLENSATTTINHTTTVRDVLTRHIKNTKLKNEHITALSRINILTPSSSVASQVEERPLVVNTYHKHHGVHNTINSANDSFIDDQQHKNFSITPSTTISSNITTNISSTSHNYSSIKSPPIGNTSKTLRFSSSHESIKVVGSSHSDNSAQKYPQKIISSGNWALQQPTDASILHRSSQQQKLLHNHSLQQPKNISLSSSDKTSFASQNAFSSCMPQQTVYSVALQHQPNEVDERISKTQKLTKSPHKRVSTTPNTSPRPGILVKNSWNNQTTNRRIENTGTSSNDLFGINSLNKNMSVIDNQIMPNGSGVDDLQRKRTRKQHFFDGDITPTTDSTSAPSDKFMMMELSGTRHRQPSYLEISTSSLLNDRKCTGNNATTSASITSQTDVPSCPPVISSCNEKIPKKRGRPKLSNVSIEHQKQLQHQMNLLHDKQLPSQHNSNHIFSTDVINNSNNQHLHLSSTPSSNVAVSANFVSPNSLFQQSNVKRPVETAASFQTELKTKRKYRKKTPEVDPHTGVVMKKPRKKGPGRKSKRELELAAQQARESAILAEMGFPVSKNCSNFDSTAETIETRQNFQQKHLGSPCTTNSVNQMTNKILFESKIAADEQMSIHALCRFRTNNEHIQKRRLTFSNFIDSSTDDFSPFERPKFHSMSEIMARKYSFEHFQPSIASTSQQQYKQSSFSSSFNESDLMNLIIFSKSFEEELNSLADNSDCLMEYRDMLLSLLNEDKLMTEECLFQKNFLKFQSERLIRYLRNDEHKAERNDDTVACFIFESQDQVKSAFDCLNLLPNACTYFSRSKKLLDSIRIKIFGQYIYKHLSTQFIKNLNKQKSTKLISLASFNGKGITTTKSHKNLLFERKILEILDFRKKGFDFSLEKGEGSNVEKLFEKLGMNYMFDLLDKLFETNQIKSLRQSSFSSLNSFNVLNSSPNNKDYMILTDVQKCLPNTLLDITRRQTKSKKRLNKRRDICLDGCDEIMEEEKIEDYSNGCDNSNESLKYFLQKFNSICVRWKTTSELYENLNDGIHKLVQNYENSNKDYQERRQSMTIISEKKSTNNSLPPHKTSSVFFRPSNEFVEGLFKDIIDVKLLENCKNDEQTGDLPSNSFPQDDIQVPTTSKKPQSQQNGQCPATEETINITSDLSSTPFMLMQNVAEQLDYTKNIAVSSREKLMYKYGRILEKNRIVNKRLKKGQNMIKPILRKQLHYCTSEQQDNFLEKQLQQTREICDTTMNLIRERSTLVNSGIDCINELKQPQGTKERHSILTETLSNSTKTTTKRFAHQEHSL